MTAPRNPGEYQPVDNGHASPDNVSPSTTTRRTVPRSRVGGLWVAAVVFAFVLLLLLIFVLENGQRVEVSFFGAHGRLPLGVALLLAAIFGVLLVALPGTARIVQLRMRGEPPGRERLGRRVAAGPLTAPFPPPDDTVGPQAH